MEPRNLYAVQFSIDWIDKIHTFCSVGKQEINNIYTHLGDKPRGDKTDISILRNIILLCLTGYKNHVCLMKNIILLIQLFVR